MKTKLVDCCVVCPFADDGERLAVPSPVWTCHAEYDANGHPRPIDADKRLNSPPTWCPLRVMPIVVRFGPPLELVP